jgi:hypothetical protein
MNDLNKTGHQGPLILIQSGMPAIQKVAKNDATTKATAPSRVLLLTIFKRPIERPTRQAGWIADCQE